ncbi:hypothetical protein [Granulicella mallensis]|nr:hypothetical protein [Granulicella mallensis]
MSTNQNYPDTSWAFAYGVLSELDGSLEYLLSRGNPNSMVPHFDAHRGGSRP